MSGVDKNKKSYKTIILRGILYTVVIPVAVILAIAAAIYIKNQIEANNALADMKSYLENKYNQEFVVENYRVEGAGLAVEGDPKADAYPKDNQSIRFTITDTGAYRYGDHDYYDSYIENIWKNELQDDLCEMLRELFDDDVKFSVDINSNFNVKSLASISIPNYKEAFSKFGKGIYITLIIHSERTYDDLPERIFQVADRFKKAGVSPSIEYKDLVHKLWIEKTEVEKLSSAAAVNEYVKENRNEY